MGVTNTPSPGTDGAVCEMCDGEGQCIVATDGLKDSCPTCGGTGRAKADCAPVAADLPAGALAAQIESAAESWATVPDRYKGEPSKRDATEVKRFVPDSLAGMDMLEVGKSNTATAYVLASDHTAAIQASLAREAALEARHAATERAACAQAETLGARLAAVEAERDAALADLDASQRGVFDRDDQPNVMVYTAKTLGPKGHHDWSFMTYQMVMLGDHQRALESRLAAVEAERDKLKAAGKILVASNTRILDEAREQLALQAEKVGRMRVALRKFGYHSRECSNDRYRQGAIGAALTCACGYDAALKDA